MNALIDMRHKRLSDELDRCSPEPLSRAQPFNAQVLGMPLGPPGPQGMLQAYHVGKQRFLITPGWLAFQEATYNHGPLSKMTPQEWPEGTTLALEIRILWQFASTPHHYPDTVFYYKTGRFLIRAFQVLALPPGTPIPIGNVPPDDTAIAAETEEEYLTYFNLATIGELSAVSDGLPALIPCHFTTSYEVHPIF